MSMIDNTKNIPGSKIVKQLKPEKLHEEAKEFLIFQIYVTSEYILDNFGLEALKNYYFFNQESYFRLKMSTFYKMIESLIKKLPKRLKIKEGLKLMINELQFIEPPKNIVILEKTNDKAIFELTKCSVRKIFNKYARKSHRLDLIDKCCLWCMESIPFAEKYGFKYRIELTKNGCLNYLE